ncbi:MAG: DUF2007 domain-containing protein [Parvibaculum sp.]|uniref:putative signal transducing protein n=1 Tax=Parvibaculum sp. TaxID=2024848 RepID=UPI0025D2DD4C|nr:DUF2007 domain-containing protein [Parvibaculum sp.]MCE9649952.1 DUF2007 domain-containing protein [Parvibaculum sp.]
MKELIRTNDMVLISYLEHRLREEAIEPLTLDGHMSVLEGSLGVLQRRIMVAEDDYDRARGVLDGVKQERDRQA